MLGRNCPSALAVLLSLLAMLPCAAAHAEGETTFVYYSYEKVGFAEQETYALVPRAATARRGMAWADLQKRAFDLIKQAKGPTYGSTDIYVNPDRSVSVNLDESKRPYFPIIVGEVVYTLTELGATGVSFPVLGGGAYQRAKVDTPAYVAVVPLWRVLPPQALPVGLVRMANGDLEASSKVRAWIEERNPKVVEYATKFLADKDERVVRAGLACLSHLKVPNLQTLLLGLLQHPNAEIRLIATTSMSGTKDAKILAALSKLMESEKEPRIAGAAAQILRDSGDQKYASVGLFHVLAGDDPEAALEAARQLGEMKEKRAVSELARVARSPHVKLRIAAVEAIASIGDSNVLKDLLGFPDIPSDAKVRAAQLLAALPEAARAQNGQVYLLLNGKGDDSANAATWLGDTRSPQVVSWLVKALDHAESKTRRAAAAALGKIGDPRALAPLAEASARIPADKEFLSQQVIGIMAAQSLESTLQLALHKNVNIRRLATESVGHNVRRNPGSARWALPVLAQRVEDLAPEVRRAAVTALGMLGGSEKAYPLIIQAKADPAPPVRAAVATALGAYRPPKGSDELLALIDDEEDTVRLKAIEACGVRKEERAVIPLINYRSHRNPEIKRLVIATLATINPAKLHSSLREVFSESVFDQDPEVRLASIQGLKVIKDPRVLDIMSVLLQDPDPRVKEATLRAYGETGFPQAMQPLLAVLQDDAEPAVKMAALDGLLSLKAKEVIPKLETLRGTEPDKGGEARYAEVITQLKAIR